MVITRMQLEQCSFYGSLVQKKFPVPGLEQIFSMFAHAENGPLGSVFYIKLLDLV